MRSAAGLSALAAALVWAGCSAPPRVPAPAPLPEAFSASGETQQPDRWWEALGDPELSRLVDEALAGNLELAAVWDRLVQARAVARREGARLLPALDLDSTVGTTWSQQEGRASSASFGGTGLRRVDRFRLGLAFAWELDVFGRLRAARDSLRYEAQASEADVRAAAILLAAQVASQWYSVVELERQLALLDSQIETNEDVARLVTIRFRAGQVGAADVLRQRQLTEQRRGERHRVEGEARVARHALAVLLGRAPDALALEVPPTLPMPGELPATGLPAALLERRPDVQRAYLAVLAADRDLHVARMDRLPRLALTSSPQFTSEVLADLVDNWLIGLAANLTAPLLDAGRRRAEVQRVEGVVSERIHGYGQVVLTSLREVEDALVLERQQRSVIGSLEAQLELARGTLDRLRDRYIRGGADYLDVLGALASQQTLERDLLVSRRALLDVRIALHRALAGGFALDAPGAAGLAASGAASAIESPGRVDAAAQTRIATSRGWTAGEAAR
ncbi:MAG: efflux transporter outer membrane subunit [Myxococcota bacterium]